MEHLTWHSAWQSQWLVEKSKLKEKKERNNMVLVIQPLLLTLYVVSVVTYLSVLLLLLPHLVIALSYYYSHTLLLHCHIITPMLLIAHAPAVFLCFVSCCCLGHLIKEHCLTIPCVGLHQYYVLVQVSSVRYARGNQRELQP